MLGRLSIFLAILALSACGGGGSDSGTPNPPPPTYTISFDVVGLSGTGLVVDATGADVAVAADGTYMQPGEVEAGTAYSIAIETQPTDQYCSVANGSGTVASADVTNVEISCMAGVTVSGTVTDNPIPFAEVTFFVGDESFTTTADGDGDFTLLIGSADEDAMVTAEALGSSEQPEVRFALIAGEFSRLAAANVDITNITTAYYALVVRAHGGMPATQAELARAERAVSASELIDIATAIKLIVDDENHDLPAGFDDVLAFAQDPVALVAFKDAAFSALQAMREEMIASPSLTMAFDADSIAAEYFVVPAAAPGLLARYGSRFEFGDNGTGAALFPRNAWFGSMGESYSFEWTFADGVLELEFDPPRPDAILNGASTYPSQLRDAGLITQDVYEQMFDEGVILVPHKSAVEAMQLRRIMRAADTEIVHSTYQMRRFFEPVVLSDRTVEIDDLVTSSGSAIQSFRAFQSDAAIPFTTGIVEGEWALNLYREVGPIHGLPGEAFHEAFAVDLVEFSEGGLATPLFTTGGAAWTINEAGELVIEYGDDWTQTVRILEQQDGVLGVYSDSLHATGRRFGNYSFVVRRDPSLDADASFFVADDDTVWLDYTHFWSALYWDEVGLNLHLLGNIAIGSFDFHADGTYDRPGFHPSGNASSFHGTWTLDAQQTLTAVEPDPAGGRERVFIPLAQDANGFFYAIEYEWRSDAEAGGADRLFTPPRIAVLRSEPPPLTD